MYIYRFMLKKSDETLQATSCRHETYMDAILATRLTWRSLLER